MTISLTVGQSFVTRDGALAEVTGHQPAGRPWPDARLQGTVKPEGKMPIGWTWLESGRSLADAEHPHDIVSAVE